MTSSLKLLNRKNLYNLNNGNGKNNIQNNVVVHRSTDIKPNGASLVWNFGNINNPMGGEEDYYIKAGVGNCHPEYNQIPIGYPDGVKVCVRRYPEPTIPVQMNNASNNGYHKYCTNLYDVNSKEPTREWNPQHYSSRRTPREQNLYRDDYTRSEVRFNGTGVKLVRTPNPQEAPLNHKNRDVGTMVNKNTQVKNEPFIEYAYSFTPVENDNEWDTRKANLTQKDLIPPIKYDYTRLHQPYPIWKEEQRYVAPSIKGNPNYPDTYDTTFSKRITNY
jgi:hypothetical protein